jgi:hypothetical protein
MGQIKDSHKDSVKSMLILEESGHLVCLSSNRVDIWDYQNKEIKKVDISIDISK